MSNTTQSAQSTLSAERQRVVDTIHSYELAGTFDKDVESDLPSVPLLPHQIDYTKSKLSSKIKTKFANGVARCYYERLIRKKQLIIDNVVGVDNFAKIQGGVVLTCNHFSVCDNYAIYRPLRHHIKGGALFKVIKEGNYTAYTGIFGFFFRHCNTLPLASRMDTMKLFMRSCQTLLDGGSTILVYPEQAMWYNYKKPRPLKAGAYRIAVKANVPVVPAFITMQDSDIIDADGGFVQKYTLHYLPAIYPRADLSEKDNCTYLMNANYQAWREVYESTYGVPLTYGEETE